MGSLSETFFHNISIYIQWMLIYSTPRRSLRICPDAGRVWTIFPPMHCMHEYLASVRHRALASASVRLRLRLCFCVCVRASACPSARLRVRPCLCVRPPVCVSVRAFAGRAMRAVRLRVWYKYIYSSSCRKTPVCRSCNRESPDVFSCTRTLLFVPYNKCTSRSFSRIDVY